MPGFFYFLPISVDDLLDGGKLRREQLANFGLVDVLGDCESAPDDVMITVCPDSHPAGGPGIVLYPKSPRADSPLDWGFNAQHQTWNNVGGAGLWLGYETDCPPMPESLERREVLYGYRCYDKLEQIWHVPVARSPQGRASVPAEFRRTAKGVERVPDPQYQALWDLSGTVHDWLHDVWQPADQDLWKYDTAVQLLQVNYRVGVEELNLLQTLGRPVLTSETIDPILCAVVDNDLPQQLRDYLAKKNAGSP